MRHNDSANLTQAVLELADQFGPPTMTIDTEGRARYIWPSFSLIGAYPSYPGEDDGQPNPYDLAD